jgi:replicative superfamily II helicase
MNQRYQTNTQTPSAFSESLSHLEFPGWSQVIVPDLWQQQAITALKEGKDVVVQAPTGSGKTFIFEHWSKLGKNSAQAIYTVPTRALANDKLAEWRARGWNVGIATGDLSENLDAPIIVATLETQKLRLIRGEGPTLMVVDEYQMLSDPDRGLNYELALALAPPHTQLLLLSGSVANPQDIVKWFNQLGRQAELVKTTHRPVPLEEVMIENLQYNVPRKSEAFGLDWSQKHWQRTWAPFLFSPPDGQTPKNWRLIWLGTSPILTRFTSRLSNAAVSATTSPDAQDTHCLSSQRLELCCPCRCHRASH